MRTQRPQKRRKSNRRNRRQKQHGILQIERLEDRKMLSADIGWASSWDVAGWSAESSPNQFAAIHHHEQSSFEFFWEPVTTNDGTLIDSPVNQPLGDSGGGSGAAPMSGLVPINEIPVRSSNPGAPITLFLDFDGHFETSWGGFSNVTTPVYDIDGDATTFSDTELERMQTAWEAVSEDFAPFNVNVTTVEPAILADGNNNNDNGVAIRVAIGGSWEDWLGSPAGGVGYVNSFTSSIPNVVYVFSDDTSSLFGETSAHEAGHSFGLYHQSLYDTGGTLIDEYNPGNNQWQPIMGGGSSSLSITSTWYNGTSSQGPNNYQDDLAILDSALGYRQDDHSNSNIGATPLSGGMGSGIIETDSDVDVFSFSIVGLGDTVQIRVDGVDVAQNLDAVLEIRDASGGLIESNNPDDTLDAQFVVALASGDYFVAVSKSSEYGYLGQYTVSVDSLPAGVTVSSSSDGLITSEGGQTATFDVVLDTKPIANVLIDVSSSDLLEGTISQSLLTFTASNWNVPQTIVVTGVDDGDVELPKSYRVLLGPATSADAKYNGLVIADVMLVNQDDDTPGWAFALQSEETLYIFGVATGPNANVYVTGRFYGTVDFDPSSNTATVTASGTLRDGFIAKYSSSGEFLWVQRFGGSDGSDEGRQIDVDAEGNVFVTGSISADTASFGNFNLTNNGYTDAFVTKLDANGEFLWVRNWGGTQTSAHGRGISVSNVGSVHVVGTYGKTVDFDPGVGTFNLTAGGYFDSYLLNLDTNGNFVSVLNITSPSSAMYMHGIDTDNNGNVYLAGNFDETAQFGTTDGVPVFHTSANGNAGSYLMKVSLSGSSINTEWVRTVAGTDDQGASRIAVDGTGGVYFSNRFTGTIEIDSGNQGTTTLTSAGSYDSLISKWDSDGNLEWSGQISGTESSRAYQMQVGGDQNVYIVGYFEGTADFNFGSTSTQLTSLVEQDAFILKLGSDGSIQNIVQTVHQSSASPLSIAVDNSGNVYVTGAFKKTVALPTGDSFVSTEGGSRDGFVMRLVFSPGISISPATGLVTGENGDSTSFNIVLDTQPTANVTIGLTSSDTSEGTISDASVTFTPENWDVVQTVTVNGVNDSAIDGDIAYTIVTAAAISSDPGYSGLNTVDVTVVNMDDDQPLILFEDSFEVSEWNGLWVEDSQNDWRRQTQRATDGNWSAEVDGRATNATLTTASAIDLSNLQSATLTFDWLIESGYDKNEFLSLDISTNGGATWQNDVRRLSGNVDSENTWHSETVDLTGYQTNNLKFRFRSTVSRSSEDANVDNVRVVGVPAGPANEAPVAGNDSYSMLEDGILTVPANGVLGNDTDSEGDNLVSLLVVDAANGSVALQADGSFSYTPNANFNGVDSFSYVANDGTSDSNLATVTINVAAVNDAPVADGQTVIVKQDTAKSITLAGSDVDGDSLAYSIQAGPAQGALAGSGTAWTYTPNAAYTGPDSFTFLVNDGTVDSAVVTVSINVTANNVPIAHSNSVSVAEDGTVSITLSGSDPDGDSITYSLVGTGPDHGTLLGTVPGLTYVPDPNYYGPDSFEFLVNDGTDDSAVATVTINVTSVNDAPVANAQSVTTAEDVPLAIALTGSDIEGDSLSFSIVSGPANGSLSSSGATPTYTPNADFNGNDSFTFRVYDGAAYSSTVSVSINVTPVNDAPTTTGQSVTTNQDSSVAIVLLANDVDGDGLSYTVTNGPDPSKGSLTGTGSNRTYTPVAGFVGTDSFTFIVNDGTVNSSSSTVTITVEELPSEVVLFEDSFEVGSNSNDWNGKWVEDSQNDFFRSTQRATDGVRSAEVDGRANNATLTQTAPINISGYATAELTFDWLIERGFDGGEYLSLDISTNGGASWIQNVRQLKGNVDAENVWHSETVDLTGYSSSDLLIRFRSSVSRSNEDANIDNVKIIASASSSLLADDSQRDLNSGDDGALTDSQAADSQGRRSTIVGGRSEEKRLAGSIEVESDWDVGLSRSALDEMFARSAEEIAAGSNPSDSVFETDWWM